MQVPKRLTAIAALALLCAGSQAQQQDQNRGVAVMTMTNKTQGWIGISGTVKDAATGKPLGGINVTYKDKTASISASNGIFALQVPASDATILFEGDGYQSKEVTLRGRVKDIVVSLYEDTYTSMYDQVTQPFGSTIKSRSPYAISSIQTHGNWGRPGETPSTYLQGRVAGLNAIRRSGTPNIGATMLLRGMSSFYASNQPLIIVDGVIFNNEDHGGSLIANHYTELLSTIDVRDIDNISVIKDGSSTYGAKGANGVIIITTARAKELGTKIDFAVYGGVNFTPTNLPVMQAGDHRIYLSEILKSKGLTDAQIQALPYMNDDKNNPEYYKYHNNTDWQKQVLKQSTSKNIYLKVTGGDNIARYALSLGYMGNEGVTSNTDMLRYNMRFNGDLNLGKRLTATTNLSFGFQEHNLRDQGVMPKTNPLYVALVKSPLLRVRDVSAQGIESPLLADRDTFNIGNPTALTDLAQGINKNYRFLGSIGFNYVISKNLTIANTVGVTNDKVRESFFVPRKGVTTDTLNTDIAYSRLGSLVNSYFSMYNDTRLTYSKQFNTRHELVSRLGLRYLYGKTEQDYGLGFNSAIDDLVSVGNGVNSLRRIGGFTGESNWLNVYLNTDYSYLDKYFISLNMAVDGSSRFGKNIPNAFTFNGNNYAVLPSIAAAWLISSEKFAKTKIIDLLKLRVSYGLSGNDAIGNYTARQTYVSQNLLGVQGLVRGGFGNDQLQWEQVRKLNAGIDASILNERISFTVDAFQHKTRKMVGYEKAPLASGFSYAISNFGRMTTKGIEAAVNARILNKTSLKLDIGITLGKYKSRIDKLSDANIISSFAGASYITQPGAGPNQFYGYKTNGVFVTDAEAAQSGLSIRNADGTLRPFTGGDIRFVDSDHNGVIDENDRQVIGNPNPELFGGATTRVVYKDFSFDMLFTFSQGNDVYNYTRNRLEAMSGFENQTEAVINRWRTNGHVTNTPKATWGDPMGNSRFSDRWIEDGSYFRLRSATISYNIPFKPGFLKYASVYITGNNLITLTKYKGYDPEFSPTESIFGQGVDNTLEPQTRSILAGVRIGL